jgi:ATP-binding cassette subfamily C protein
MIVALAEGYDTRVGDRGASLAAGQRQRIALARALYGEPFLVVLDEPNSNLDTEGEAALRRAIEVTRERGAVVVVVSHRPSVLEAGTHILTLEGGQQQSFGPKQDPAARPVRRDPPNFGSFKILPQQQGA